MGNTVEQLVSTDLNQLTVFFYNATRLAKTQVCRQYAGGRQQSTKQYIKLMGVFINSAKINNTVRLCYHLLSVSLPAIVFNQVVNFLLFVIDLVSVLTQSDQFISAVICYHSVFTIYFCKPDRPGL